MVAIATVLGVLAGALIGGIGSGVQSALAPSPPQDPYVDEHLPPEDQASSGDYSPLAEGEPGSPAAVAPLRCDGPCFDQDSARLAIMDHGQFEDWGLPLAGQPWDPSLDRKTADVMIVQERDAFTGAGFSPAECFATWSEFPFAEPEGAPVEADFVSPLTEHWSERYPNTVLMQSVRLFSDTVEAEEYMAFLTRSIDECPRYRDAVGYAADVVTHAPGLHPDDSMAAVGFVRSPQAGQRIYVFDLQRGNMVIRSVAYSDGGLDGTDFRTLMMKQMLQMVELEPIG